MGVKLSSRVNGYKYESKSLNKIFKPNEEYFDLPADVEKYLLNTGNFFFVPNPGTNQKPPANIAAADKNRKLIEEGIIDGKGNLKKVNPRGNEAVSEVKPAKTPEVFVDLDIDDHGNEVVTRTEKAPSPGRKLRGNPNFRKQKEDILSTIIK